MDHPVYLTWGLMDEHIFRRSQSLVQFFMVSHSDEAVAHVTVCLILSLSQWPDTISSVCQSSSRPQRVPSVEHQALGRLSNDILQPFESLIQLRKTRISAACQCF
jgi:hypothetical protein